jgi:drug/metabolite transporter (DMT)-like permease
MALGAGYRRGDLSVVYPVARGSAPLGVALLSGPLVGEWLGPLGWAGVVTIVLGLALVAAAGLVTTGANRGLPPGLGLGLATGACTVAYSLIDRRGVSLVAPPLYLALQFIGTAAVMAPAWLPAARRPRLAALARSPRGAGAAVLAALGMFGAYVLVLTAMTLAPVAYVVAGREMAIVFGTLLGATVLGERVSPLRAAGAALTAGGVFVLALA